MASFFSVSSVAFSSTQAFNTALTSTYIDDGDTPFTLYQDPVECKSFNIQNKSIYGIALQISACNPVSSNSVLTVELTGVNGSYKTETFNLSSFVTTQNSDNQLPLNWQILKFDTPLQVSASDVIITKLNTTNNNELTLFGKETCFNYINSKTAFLSGNISFNRDPVGEKYIDLTSAKNSIEFIEDTSNYELSNTDFTIDGWYYIPSATVNSTWNPIISLGNGVNYGDYVSWCIVYNKAEEAFYFIKYNTEADTVSYKLNCELILNRWNFITVMRKGNELSLWINGINISTITISGSFNRLNEEYLKRRLYLQIGKLNMYGTVYNTKMYVSTVRIIKNQALYTATSVAAPTAVLSLLANSLLYRDPDFYGDNYQVTENEQETIKPLTVNNSTAPPLSSWLTFNGPIRTDLNDKIPFLNGQKYVVIDSTSAMVEDFTIEFWFFSLRENSPEEYILDGRSGTTSTPYLIGLSGGKIRIYESNTSTILAGSYIPQTWYHLSVCRKAGVIQVALNGQSIAAFNSDVNSWGGSSLWIGRRREDTTKNFVGYISNLRITNGKAVYFNGFETPSAELLPTSNTIFLLKSGYIFNSSIITTTPYNASSLDAEEQKKDCLEFNPQTTNSPFNQDILDWYRCDTNNYIELVSSADYDLRGKYWSIDFWIYPVTVGVEQKIINFTNDANYTIKLNALNQIVFNNYPNHVKIPLHTWTHVGITRGVADNQYSTTRILINGKHIDSLPEDMINMSYNGTFTEVPWTSTANLFIGSSFKGYISNLHIAVSKNNAPLNIARDELFPSRPIDGASNFSRVASFSKTIMYYENDYGPYYSSSQPNDIPAPYNKLGDKTVRMSWESPSYPDRPGSYLFSGDSILVIDNRHGHLSTRDDDFGSWSNTRFTYELWFKPYANNRRMALISSGSGNPQDPEATVSHIFVNGTEIEVVPMYSYNRKPLISRSTFMTRGANIKVNQWNHVAVQRNLSMIIECYVNGIKVPFYNNNTLAPTTLAGLKAIPSLQNIDGEFLVGSRAVFIGGARKDELNNVFVHSLFQGLITQIRVSKISLYYGDDIRSALYSDPSYKIPRPLRAEDTWPDEEGYWAGRDYVYWNPFKFFLGTRQDQTSYFDYPYLGYIPTAPTEKQNTSVQKTVLLLKSPYNKLQNSYIERKTDLFQPLYPSTFGNWFTTPDSETSYHINNKNFDLHDSDFTINALVEVNYPTGNTDDAPWLTMMYKILERKGSYVFGITTHRAAVTRWGPNGNIQDYAPRGTFNYISLFFGYQENGFLNPEQSLGITPGNITQNLFSGRIRDGSYYTSPPLSPNPGEVMRVTFIGDYKTRTVTGYINDIPWGTFPYYPKTPNFSNKNIISFGSFSTISAGYRRGVGPVSRAVYNNTLKSPSYSRGLSDLFIGKEKLRNTLVYSYVHNRYYIPQFTDTYPAYDENNVFVLNSSNNYSFTTTGIVTSNVSYLPSVVSTDSSTSPDTAALYFDGSKTIGANSRTSTVGAKMYMVGYRRPFTFESWVKPADDGGMIIFSLGVHTIVSTDAYNGGYLSTEQQTVYPFRVGIQSGKVYYTAETFTLWTEQNIRQYNVGEWFHISVSRLSNNYILIAINGQIIFHRQLYRTEMTSGILRREIGMVRHAQYEYPFRSVLGTICVGGYRNAVYNGELISGGSDWTFRFAANFTGSFRGHMAKLRLHKGTFYDTINLPTFNANYTGNNSHIGIHLTTAELQTVNDIPNCISYPSNSIDAMFPQPDQNINNIILNFSGTNQKISVPSKEDFNLFKQAWTFEAWVNLFAISNGRSNPLICKGNSYSIFINTNNTISFANSKTIQTSTATISRFRWVHLSFVCDTQSIKLYIDGTLSHTYTNVPLEDNNALLFVGSNLTDSLAGSLSNIRLINGRYTYIAPNTYGIFPIKEDTVLLMRSPYTAFTYQVAADNNTHIGSVLFRDNITPITITLDSKVSVSNLFIHNQSTLNITDKGDLTVNGPHGLNVTVGGRLNII